MRPGPALTLISRGTLPSGTTLDPAREVWLLVARGDGRMASLPVPNATTTPDIAIVQVAVILDGVTGEVLFTSAFSPSLEIDAAVLPQLRLAPTPAPETGYRAP